MSTIFDFTLPLVYAIHMNSQRCLRFKQGQALVRHYRQGSACWGSKRQVISYVQFIPSGSQQRGIAAQNDWRKDCKRMYHLLDTQRSLTSKETIVLMDNHNLTSHYLCRSLVTYGF